MTSEDFCSEALLQLEKLLSELKEKEELSDLRLEELFRFFHTIKGRARVFGFRELAGIIHLAEDSVRKGNLHEIISCVEQAIKALKGDFEENSSKLRRAQIKVSILPIELANRLASQEKERLSFYLLSGRKVLLLRKSFGVQDFSSRLNDFLKEISRRGSILALLPSSVSDLEVIFVPSTKPVFEDAQILDEFYLDKSLVDIIERVVNHGREIAEELGKKVEFEVELGLKALPGQLSGLIFDVLIHLVRNAIDHGIEKVGRVVIQVTESSEEVVVKVSDNGSGMDFEKVRERAIEKGLISDEAQPSSAEILELVFYQGISTSDEVSEISGRGVGLDLVKKMIENVGGKIKIETGSLGTAFEIVIPKKQL
ncbi:MAG: ATP-binding protein [Pyrinomonadaceae bacterium]|nr:ATP-binding protein [Pyrinomonadaceae bacterium]MCX7640434.1 ATP-binding protein [Pyrinomonadaceae bacterium]MDW8304861.1 ATP-binding protein [Acidobacteriota bacterium]